LRIRSFACVWGETVFSYHIAKIADLIPLGILAVRLNRKRPVDPWMNVYSVAAGLTDEFKAKGGQETFKVSKANATAASENGFVRAH
jgi:hypothetical protein